MAKNSVMDMSDLKDLDPLSKRLNAASDDLTKALETIQRTLNGLALGVEVFLDTLGGQELRRESLGVGEDGLRTVCVHALGYGRIGDGWGLVVRASTYREAWDPRENVWDATGAFNDCPDDVEYKPLLKASRDMRVKAVALLPDLIDALRSSAEAVIQAVEQAKQLAEKKITDSLT